MKRIFLLIITISAALLSSSAFSNIGSSPAIDQQGRIVVVRSLDDGQSELTFRLPADPSNGIGFPTKTFNEHVYASPVVDIDNHIYISTLGLENASGTVESKVYKLDENLNEVWSVSVDSAVYSTAAVSPFESGKQGNLFLGTKAGIIFSLSTLDGAINWQVDTGFEIGGSAVLWPLDNTLTIANRSGEVFVIEQETGAIIGQHTVSDRSEIMTPVIAGNGEIIAATLSGHVVKLDRKANVIWQKDLEGKFISSPLVDRLGNIYLASYNGEVYSLSPNGDVRWSLNTYTKIYASPILTSQNELIIADVLDAIFANFVSVNTDGNIAPLRNSLMYINATTGVKRADRTLSAKTYASLNLSDQEGVVLVDEFSNIQVVSIGDALLPPMGTAKFQLSTRNSGSHVDTDGDQFVDAGDDFPNDPAEWLDTDLDGIGNNADTDDDNDSFLDVADAFPLDGSEWYDTDEDGIGNNADLDDDNDGLADIYELNNIGSDPLQADTDGDGLDDFYEVNTEFTACGTGTCVTGYTSPLSADSDGDGINDNFEVNVGLNPLVNDSAGDYDNDGYDNTWEAQLGTDPFENEFDSREVAIIETFSSTDTTGKVLVSPDGKHLYTGGGAHVFDINPETGALENERATGLTANATSVISANGEYLFRIKTSDTKYIESFNRDVDSGALTYLAQTYNSDRLTDLKAANGYIYASVTKDNYTTFYGCIPERSGDSTYYVISSQIGANGEVNFSTPGSMCILKDQLYYSDAVYGYSVENGVYLAGYQTLRLSSSNKLTSENEFSGVISHPLSSDHVYAISQNRMRSYSKYDTEYGANGVGVSGISVWEGSAYTKRLYGLTPTGSLYSYHVSIEESIPTYDRVVHVNSSSSSLEIVGQYLYVQTQNGVVQLEAGYTGIGHPDTDGDGVPDLEDEFWQDPTEQYDTDGDGIGNNADTDDDNDGTPDVNDDLPLDPTETIDTDGDGIGNNSDTDDDGDGVADVDDVFPLDSTESVDTDNDGIGNNADTDDDNDGVEDGSDAFPLDPTETLDTDSDGIGNNTDSDDDGDGIADSSDAFPLDPSEDTDTDNDGIGNNADADDDGDGAPDLWEVLHGYDPLLASDGALDNDGDGLTTVQEYEKGSDPALADTDGDGVNDNLDDLPTNEFETVDTDGDGIGNNEDLDDDNDGMPDSWEVQYGYDPLTPTDSSLDSDGDGLTDLEESVVGTDPLSSDTDGDGIPDSYEVANNLNPYEDDSQFDADGDGYHNLWEYQLGTDPFENEFDDRAVEVMETFPSTTTSGKVLASPDGKHLYTGGGSYVFDINPETGALENERSTGVTVGATKAVIHPSGEYIIVVRTSDTKYLDVYGRDEQNGGLTLLNSTYTSGSIRQLKINSIGTLYVVDVRWTNLQGCNGSSTVVRTGVVNTINYSVGLYGQADCISDSDGQFGVAISNDDRLVVNIGGRYNGYLHARKSGTLTEIYKSGSSSAYNFQEVIENPLSSNHYYGVAASGIYNYHFQTTTYRSGLSLGANPVDGESFGSAYSKRVYALIPGYLKVVNASAVEGRPMLLDASISISGANSIAMSGKYVYVQTSQGTVVQLNGGYTGIGHPDSDNDGVEDRYDAFPYDPSEQYDTDGDGVGDNADVFPNDPTEQYDFDSDGIGNNADTDDDNDGYLDEDDAFPLNPNEWLDTDSDGIGNNEDDDDDDDGMPDSWEVSNGLDPLNASDRDQDADNDGLSNYEEFDIGTAANNADTDGDSIPDGWEVTYGLDPTYTEDGLEDWDSDGHSNADEYVVNTSPLDPRWYPGAPGLKKWGFDSGDKVRTSMAFAADGTAYFTNDSGILFAIDSNGNELWQHDTQSQVTSSPAIGLSGEVYLTDLDGDLTAVSSLGDELWSFTVGQPITTTPIVGDNGVVFFGADDGYLYAIEPDGSEKWTFEVGEAIKSSPKIDKNGVLHFGADDGYVYAVHSESGQEFRP